MDFQFYCMLPSFMSLFQFSVAFLITVGYRSFIRVLLLLFHLSVLSQLDGQLEGIQNKRFPQVYFWRPYAPVATPERCGSNQLFVFLSVLVEQFPLLS